MNGIERSICENWSAIFCSGPLTMGFSMAGILMSMSTYALHCTSLTVVMCIDRVRGTGVPWPTMRIRLGDTASASRSVMLPAGPPGNVMESRVAVAREMHMHIDETGHYVFAL